MILSAVGGQLSCCNRLPVNMAPSAKYLAREVRVFALFQHWIVHIRLRPNQFCQAQTRGSMDKNQEFFITTARLKVLARLAELDVSVEIDAVYKAIFDKRDLTPYVNETEARDIFQLGTFIQKSEDALIQMESARLASNKVDKFLSKNQYVFVSGSPKFHESDLCSTLHQDFLNFRVPEEIMDRGDEEVRRFRLFAHKHKSLIGDGREDVFLMRLRDLFRLKNPLDRVLHINSGSSKISSAGSDSMLWCVGEIEDAIWELDAIGTTEAGARAVSTHIYAPLRILKEEELGVEVRRVLEAKQKLINSMVAFTIHKHKGSSTFSERFLKFHGFEPCAACCKDRLRVAFPRP